MAKKDYKNWKIGNSIGQGGQGVAKRATHKNHPEIKGVLKELINDNRLSRFRREIKALERINSPYIPKLLDYSLESPPYFFVTPELGINLEKFTAETPLDLNAALNLFEMVIKAIKDAHNIGVVHRDIKPNNIIVSEDGSIAYLIDFGISDLNEPDNFVTGSSEALGNAAFAAPECYSGREEEPGPASDIYSLGKLLFWMASGGQKIVRENLTPTKLDKIKHDNPTANSILNGF